MAENNNNNEDIMLINKMNLTGGEDVNDKAVGTIGAKSSHQRSRWEMMSPPPMKKRFDDYVADTGKDMQDLLDQFIAGKETLRYSNRICFLSNEDFDYMIKTKHSTEEALGWKLLPENIIYRVEKMTPIQTKWGSRCIIQLRNAMGEDIKVWAPSNLVRDLKSGFKLNGKDCLAFIKSLGEKETNVVGEPKRKFYDFETVYLPL